MAEFLSTYSTALFTLAGALVGALSSFLTASIMAKKETRLKLREKLLDRRIQSHELIIDLSHSMRSMKLLGGFDINGELNRTPDFFLSETRFNIWFDYFHRTMKSTSIWLGTSLIHELNLLQDYIANLNEFLRLVPTQNYPSVGQIISLDFVRFSESIENLAYEFFINDLEKLRISSLPEWHKYPVVETKKRINDTEFIIKSIELKRLVNANL